MKKNKLVAFALSLLVYGAQASAEQGLPKDADAIVNDIAVPTKLIDQSIKLNVEQGKKDSPELRKAIKSNKFKSMSQVVIFDNPIGVS
jgi:hypothetical protein